MERTLKQKRCLLQPAAAIAICCALGLTGLDAAENVEAAIEAVRRVGTDGQGFGDALPAAQQLQQIPAEKITQVLDGAKEVNPIAENWIRGIVFGIAQKSGSPDLAVLKAYVNDQAKNAIGRGIAMELIQREDSEVAQGMLSDLMNDPSLAIREMAVEQAIGNAKALAEDQADAAIGIYRDALTSARHPKQLSRIVESLGKLGEAVTTAEAFSLILNWKSIAPFDNEGGFGYAAVYAPEKQFTGAGQIDLSQKHDGKAGEIIWQDVAGSNDEGLVNLADVYNKEKGAVAYLFAEFDSPEQQDAQARLGCINANKVWVNGEEVMATEVYHSGSMLDQYVAPFELKKGKNTILLKICQNEQEESWAQRWEFQFRITDPTGKGLESGN
ncbi:MAG: hypothetical protein VXZ38_07300 [Planctomycetota bacterium]|nr:hypothetical protein [Planctomycetota bacterium]